MALIKQCPVCSVEFHTYPSVNKICCSRSCAYEFQKIMTENAKKKKCKVCGKEFVPKHPKSPGHCCSYRCIGIFRRHDYVIRMGYRHLHMPDHPHSTKQGYYPEHRYIMEQHLDRILERNERVHHINHDRQDNRLINLLLMTDSEHKRYHAKQRKRKPNGIYE